MPRRGIVHLRINRDDRRPVGILDKNTKVFIVRIWREPREIEGAPPHWRGVIEHVPSGERRYLTRLTEITAFIATHLQGMGVDGTAMSRLSRWLRPWSRPGALPTAGMGKSRQTKY